MLAAAVFAATFVLGLALFVALVVALPTTYFLPNRDSWFDQHLVLRWMAILARNLLGLLIVALGVVLSLPGIPGQGLLTILIGLTLLDFPGKQRLVQRFVSRPGVLRNLNRVRAWFGRRPLLTDHGAPPGT